MLRSLIILCWMFATATMLNAQAVGRDGFTIGGNVSVTSSWIINQNAFELLRLTCEDEGLWGSEPDYRFTPGYSAGVSASFRSGDFWGVLAELNYTKAGQNYKDSFTTAICPDHSNFERKFTLHYLQLPLLAKFTAAYRSDVKWYVTTGPQLGFLLGAKEQVTIGDSETPPGTFTAARDKVRTIDLDFVVGTGADIFLSDNLFVSVGFKTYISLMDINSHAVSDFISANDAGYQVSRNFSAGIQVGVHYLFDWVGTFYR